MQRSTVIEYIDPLELKEHWFNRKVYGDDGFTDLVESVSRLGVQQAIYIKKDNTVISGHRRWRSACQAHLQVVPVIRVSYPSESAEKEAIIEHNRYRNKNGQQLFNEGRELKQIYSKQAEQRKAQAPGQPKGIKKSLVEYFPQETSKTRDKVAEAIGLGSGRQWDKLEEIAETAPELLPQIKPGGLSITKALSKATGEKRRAEREKRIQESKESIKDTSDDKYIKFILGDFRIESLKLEDNSINHIFTDPPYSSKYLDLWSDLSTLAARVLEPGGFCITYSGTYHLPEIIRRLSEHLEYYWQFIILHKGCWQRIETRCITTGYKPILVFVKPPVSKPLQDTWDLIDGTGREKSIHEWAQALGEAKDVLERLTYPGQTILDPFAGSGTVAIACRDTQRFNVSYEIDENSYIEAISRIQQSG